MLWHMRPTPWPQAMRPATWTEMPTRTGNPHTPHVTEPDEHGGLSAAPTRPRTAAQRRSSTAASPLSLNQSISRWVAHSASDGLTLQRAFFITFRVVLL